jgi:hypothetical protein
MTLNEYNYEIVEAVRGEIHDDDILDNRLIKQLIHSQRAVWLRNELNRNRDIPEVVIQDLGCVEIEPASAIECCDFSSDCKVYRTKLKIPKPISLHFREAIERVGPSNITQKPFSLKDYKEAIFFGNGRFNSKMVAAYYKDDKMYLVSKMDIIQLYQYINIRLVASDPTEAAKFKHCTGQACYNDDMEYPVTDWMWIYMKEHIVNQLLKKSSIPSDNTNDANHELPMK